MAAYALIAGIDEYSNPAWRLGSAVSDALRFTSWALQEGGVAPENVRLLLSPLNPLGANTIFGVPVLEGTSDTLHTILFKEFRRGWGKGEDRLYVYFAGHGCSHPDVRGEKRPEPVLIFSDVAELPDDYKLLYTFSDILDVLRGCGPREQFFFLDACRDFALDGIVASGGIGGGRYFRPPNLATGEEASKQFVIYATAPGGRALEIGKGVFCDALIRGLRGEPGAPRRLAGKGDYELHFSDLFAFVRKQVERKVALCVTDAPRYVQKPEQEPDPAATDPVVRHFSEAEMTEAELLVRLDPRAARATASITVLFEDTPKLGPDGPPSAAAKSFRLKPAWYSVKAEAPGFEPARVPVYVPCDGPVALALSTASAQSRVASQDLSFTCLDNRAIVLVVDPAGTPRTAMGRVDFPRAAPGIYRARIISADGAGGERWQAFEFPTCSGSVPLDAPPPKIGPGQMEALSKVGIQPAPYMQPSESLGVIADLKPVSLLGFAAYARYTMSEDKMSRLRSFGLEPVPDERKGDAWLTVLLTAEVPEGDPAGVLRQSSVAVYHGRHYELGQFRLLSEPSAGAQFLRSVEEGNVTVELRVPDLPPTRFPLTCMAGRVAVLCVGLRADQSFDVQMYLIPFRMDRMQPDDLRRVEQAQRFYAGSEPMPEPMIEDLLNLKRLDPLLGAMTGYTLVRQGKAGTYRGEPDPALLSDAWNDKSPMQNMIHHFGLLPDAHVLAGLCEPDQRDQHFARALALGMPLFSEGFESLFEFYASAPAKLPPGDEARARYINMRRARRSLATGSAFSTWIAYEPALIVEQNHFGRPPAVWSILETKRDAIQDCARAVGCLRVRSETQVRDRTAFLVAPDLILTANHTIEGAVVQDGARWIIPPGASMSFAMADDILRPHGPELAIREIVAYSAESRMALLRLESPVTDARPLSLPGPGTGVKAGQRIFLIGYPFLDDALDPALIRHVFGDRLGTQRLQPGWILAVPETRNFDHDAFTMKGSGGSPVIDLATGTLLGVHWGGMDQAGFRRGRAIALWKPENFSVLTAAALSPVV